MVPGIPVLDLTRYCLDTRTTDDAVQASTASRSDAEEQGNRAIVCAACSAHLSDSSQRIEVAGQHHHTFFNPAGVVYRVMCFAAAPGCSGIGPFSAEFSWFPGQRWQIALCANCHEHVGWHFAGAGSFSALIEQRIRQLDA